MKQLLFFIASLMLSLSAMAWPTKPITIIVTNPPGGNNDKFARWVQKDLQSKIPMPITIQYMPGAGGAVAANHVIAQPNDNHTFVLSDAGFVVGPAMLGTNTYNEFLPLLIFGEHPYVMFTSNTESKIKQQIKRKQVINVGVANQGEIWANELSWAALPNLIPYKGLAPMLNDVIPGHTEYGILSLSGTMPSITSGQVTPVMVFADKRVPLLPNTPTAKELGINGSYTKNWNAIWSKNDTDKEAVTEFAKLLQESVSTDTGYKELAGFTVLNYGPAKAREYADREIKIFERIAAKNKK